jgi:hypothetical protein
MKKVEEKYFCDYCGEKCVHTDFVVPEIEQSLSTLRQDHIQLTKIFVLSVRKRLLCC